MLFSGCLRSNYAYAKILNIDTSKAKAIKGVHAVLTAEDVPKPQSWADYPYLCDGTVKYVGETVAIVAAETASLVEDALKAIEVEYEELEGVYTIEDALKEDAVRIKTDTTTARSASNTNTNAFLFFCLFSFIILFPK